MPVPDSGDKNVGFGNLCAAVTIMVVDDNRSIHAAFRAAFTSYRVVAAGCAEEALAILRQPNDISLIVLDVAMPGQTGLEALSRIKECCPEGKVIILSGYSCKEVILEALRNKADDFLEKPFDCEEMRIVIQRLLRESGRTECAYDARLSKVEQISRFMRRNFNKPFSLKDAAGQVYLGPKYLSRLFKKETGVTFNQYKMTLRVQAAKTLLLESRFTVSEIADKLGYQSPVSLTKAFKKMTGYSPANFRKGSGARRPQAVLSTGK